VVALPETILNCLCLNIVSLVAFSALGVEEDDDKEMVERCLRGSRQAFDMLVEKYYRKIYNLAYGLWEIRRKPTTWQRSSRPLIKI
jgi:hypothetical protein